MKEKIQRTEAEIDQVLMEAEEGRSPSGSKFPGMSYEEGILAMYRWLTDDADQIECHPMES